MNEKVKLQNLGLAILVGILASALIVNAGYIGDPATTHYHGQFSQFPYSYIIEPFNSTYYQSTNASGYSYQTTDASQIENDAWGNTTNGAIFYRGGTYNFPTVISHSGATKNIRILGEGMDSTVFNYSGSDTTASFWTIGDFSTFEISHLTLNGNNNVDTIFNSTGKTVLNGCIEMKASYVHFNDSDAGFGVTFYRVSTINYIIDFHDNRIENCNGGGLIIDVGDGEYYDNYIGNNAGSAGIYMGISGANNVHNNYLGGSEDYGIYLYSAWNIISANRIDHHGKDGIYIRAQTCNTITGNMITNVGRTTTNTYCGIYLMNVCENNTIVGNTFYQGASDNRTKYCIREVNPAHWSVIRGNSFAGYATAPYSLNETTIQPESSAGFVTQNCGAVVTCSNGTWIAHGLAGDPSTTGSITLSFRGPTQYNATTVLFVPTVLQSNSTHFQIEFNYWFVTDWTIHAVTPTMGQTIWWFATYKP